MKTKVCSKCFVKKEVVEFKSKHNQCKCCVYEYQKEYYKQKRKENHEWVEKEKQRRKIYYEKNKDLELLRRKIYYENNKEKIKEYSVYWRTENKEYSKNYRKLNRDKINKQVKTYRELNKEKINLRNVAYNKKRLQTDELYKLCKTLRRRIRFEIKRKGYVKDTRTTDILGCTIEEVKTHLEQQFKKGMNWANHGDWHIDHIIPLSSAKDKVEILKLCHYTNLQPLWANENLQKGSKLNYAND
jgi:hypothetical protein